MTSIQQQRAPRVDVGWTGGEGPPRRRVDRPASNLARSFWPERDCADWQSQGVAGRLKRTPAGRRFLELALEALPKARLRALPPAVLDRFLSDVPKIDLHTHLEGAIPPETFFRIAQRHGVDLEAALRRARPEFEKTYGEFGAQLPDRLQTLDDFRAAVALVDADFDVPPERHFDLFLRFLSKFVMIGELFTTRDLVRDVTAELVRSAAREHGVEHLELRFSPLYMAAAHHPNDPEAMIEGVIDGVREATADSEISVKLILIAERHQDPKDADRVVALAEKYRDRGVVAVDLANDEARFPPMPFTAAFQRAQRKGLAVTMHGGETAQTDQKAAENVAHIVEVIGARRVGHGIKILADPNVAERVRELGVVLENCLTSNQQTGAVPPGECHPLGELLRKGFKVTANTDDPAVSGITFTSEMKNVIESQDLNLIEYGQLLDHAVEGAFLTPIERARLGRRMDEKMHRAKDQLLAQLSLEDLHALAKDAIENTSASAAERERRLVELDDAFRALSVSRIERAW